MADKPLPKFWATTIAKVLVGEQPCLLSAWVSGHAPEELGERTDGGNLARWKANHTALLEQTAQKMTADGWKVRKEQYWHLNGRTAMVNGKADISARKEDHRPLIVDCKSGNPRDSDAAQVLIYMNLIPLAWNAPEMKFNGLVVYPNHTVELTPVDAERIKGKVMDTVKRLAVPERPAPSPGRDACRNCHVKNCAVREAGDVAGETDLF